MAFATEAERVEKNKSRSSYLDKTVNTELASLRKDVDELREL